MNVFIDSNILHEDYFFEKESQRKILDYAEKGLIHLYMADVVRLELRKQFLDEIRLNNDALKKVKDNLIRLQTDKEINLIDEKEELDRFDKFYKRLELFDDFTILTSRNEFLPYIIDRAVYKKKPFTETKSELKDTIIWKTYSYLVEKDQLTDCIFLTNNTKDFCDKKDKSKVHHELLIETSRFTVINSAFEFIRSKATLLESPERKLKKYIESLNFTNELVLKLIRENFEKILKKQIHQKIENLSPNDLLKSNYWYDGYVCGYDVEILECTNTEYEIIKDYALISGSVFVCCETESYQYNVVRDSGEEQFSFLSSQNITFEVCFNFDLKENENCDGFEITDISISDID